jgi:hypothetical protein
VKKHFFSLKLLDVQHQCSVESICKCSFLKFKIKNVPDEMLKTWSKQVQMLIIDNISFSGKVECFSEFCLKENIQWQ